MENLYQEQVVNNIIKEYKSSGAAGDIVCWSGHVGICDGAGNVIHSYNANHNIRKDSIANVSKWDGRKVLGYVTFN